MPRAMDWTFEHIKDSKESENLMNGIDMDNRINRILIKHGYREIDYKEDTHTEVLQRFMNALMDELGVMKNA